MMRGMPYLLTLLLLVVLLFTACDAADEVDDTSDGGVQAVAFGAYVNRGTTRGGASGPINTTTIRGSDYGFGVYAYHTGTAPYNQMALPNFMYNQYVGYDVGISQWTYTPKKYWPKDDTPYEDSRADLHHLVSFFAYAPYTSVNNLGKASDGSTTGIVALSRPTDNGDPLVTYFASMNPAETVDLCWASPLENRSRPVSAELLHFQFRHALSSLNVQIQADIDEVEANSNTRIFVRSITFVGFTDKGQLNLNNATDRPLWNKLDCDCDLTASPYTLYDGRRDGNEGLSAAPNERPTGLNPKLIQHHPYNNPFGTQADMPGVTTSPTNLFDSETLAAPIYIIPTNDQLRVSIVYDVETYDPKLTSQFLGDGATHGSSIENSISAYVTTDDGSPITMQAGSHYTLRLHLGLASVKVSATCSEWPNTGVNAEVNLPDSK